MSSFASSSTHHYQPPPSSTESAVKTRIMNHMNADRSDCLHLYLRHFSKLPPAPRGAPEPQLTDISLSGITISHHLSPGSKQAAITFIPFNPPMQSLSESRPRLVAMANEAKEAVGGGDSQESILTQVTGPGIVGWIITLSVLQTVVFFCPPVADLHTFSAPDAQHRSPNPNPNYPTDLPDTWYTRNVMFNFPPLIRVLSTYRREFWGLVVGLHVLEAVGMDRVLTRRYGVKRGSVVWAGWIWWALVEGYGSFRRVEHAYRTQGKRKH